ncbi:MAG: hypothetical protein OXH94_10320 [Rhodospirillales bacterium]|nr:hypothetical protein [Rhodospirillales bacterium]
MKLVKSLALAAVAVSLLPTATAGAAEFYAGKKITCVVPYSPGGGTDSFFRVVVPHLARLIPGKPDVIINNMSGAGGLKANNYASNEMPNNGSEMLCAPWLSIAQLTKRKGVRFDYSKMRVVGGESAINTAIINKDVLVGGDRTTIGKGKQPLVVAGLSPSSTLDLRQRLGLDVLGVKYKYVPGYRGSAKQIPAFLSGEVSLLGLNYGTYVSVMKSPLVDQGPGMLWVDYPNIGADGGASANAVLKNQGVPALDEVHMKMHGKPPSGQHWEAYKVLDNLSSMGLSVWLPAGTPDAAFNALKAGWEALPNDAAFKAAHEKAFGKAVNFVNYKGALTAQNAVATVKPDMVKFFQDYIAQGEK